jgi:hypothetical protein
MIGLVRKSLQFGGFPARNFPYASEHPPLCERLILAVDAMSRR